MENVTKDQVANLEKVLVEKRETIDKLTRELESIKSAFEEKMVYMQMQLNNAKSRQDNKDKEQTDLMQQMNLLKGQIASLQRIKEENEGSIGSNRDMIKALQARLMEVEPELSASREKIRSLEKNSGATAVLKVEQEALLNSLRSDLKKSLLIREEDMKKIKELEEYKAKADGQLLKMTNLVEQVNVLQAGMEDKNSLITRLRAEAQASERNHAMKTAMLATCEAQLASLKEELQIRTEAAQEAIERVTSLQTQLASTEARFQERISEDNRKIHDLQVQFEESITKHTADTKTLKSDLYEQMEILKKDHSKKSAMARTLLSEREEEVRVLSSKVQSLQEEIASGAPSERRIFELAQVQAKREATFGMQR